MTKYIADYLGETFTRKSDRTYTHCVVARRNMDRDVSWYKSSAERKMMVKNHSFYVSEANPATRKHMHYSEKELARYAAIAAMTADEYADSVINTNLARIAEQKAAGYYTRFICLGWCGRPDLAQKLAAKEGKFYIDVKILEAKGN